MISLPLTYVPDNSSKGLCLEYKGEELRLLLVCKSGRIYCYRNQCPHTGVCLDWVPDQFLNPEHEYIQCATHGALFQIEDGYCVSGPCAGDKLRPVEVQQDRESFHLNLPSLR